MNKPQNTAIAVILLCSMAAAADVHLNVYYHHAGPLAGTLKSDVPLPLFDADANHLWNRIFAAFYIRPRRLPATNEQAAMVRYEGGDVIEFLAWGTTKYWSGKAVFQKVNPLLDEFLDGGGAKLISNPLKRVVFQHDLWAVYDHLIDLNNRRIGDLETRTRRSLLCLEIAKCMQQLALSADELKHLPNTYTVAVNSGAFVARHNFDATVNYLPHALLDESDEWVEIDFYYPDMHEDIMGRFISLHARSFLGRSHYRIFYRFPEGRKQVVAYLKDLEEQGIDWKHAAQFGFIRLQNDVPQIPVGTEVLLLQQMISMDDQLRPVPTNIVESVQFRAYRNIDGSGEPQTNTGVGMNVLDYRMKRHLLFDSLSAGGLEREPEGELQYRVAIGGSNPRAPDWGYEDKKVLFQQCADCHMSARLQRLGVASVPSIIHSGGFGAGAMMGVSRPVTPDQIGVRGKRVARYKSRHESYRRLLEFLGR
ncbi:MAG: hypothetical protein ABGZ23_16125 [Fuerstiella sp.]|nr:hypothetical protein [Fuerstiella sp.]